MAVDKKPRKYPGPCTEAVSVEDVRLLLKMYVKCGIQNSSFATCNDTESFLEDHKQFMKNILRCTERLNPEQWKRPQKSSSKGALSIIKDLEK